MGSTRGAASYKRTTGGLLVPDQAAGGLASALVGALDSKATWVCAAQGENDIAVARRHAGSAFVETILGRQLHLRLVETPDFGPFSDVLARIQLLFTSYEDDFDTDQVESAFEAYRAANQALAAAIVGQMGHRTRVMLNDHHLYLAPAMVRAARPDARIWLYVHMSEAAPQAWRVLPERMRWEIFSSMLECDLLAFHSEMWASEFFDICGEMPGVAVDRDKRLVSLGRRHTAVRVYSLPVDKVGWLRRQASPPVQDMIGQFKLPGVFQFVGVDRSDPPKNLLRIYRGYMLMLQEHPELKGKVVFRSHVIPSRQDLATITRGEETYPYREYLDAIREEVAAVNEALNPGDEISGWTPIIMTEVHDRDLGCALMSVADAGVAIPRTEGMNSVAKEISLLSPDADLLVSPYMGAAELLTAATRVDPFDRRAIARGMYEIVMKEPAARRRVGHANNVKVMRENPRDWLRAQVLDVDAVSEGR